MVWKHTSAETPIELFFSASLKESGQRPLLFLGGVHGDEPEGVWLARHTLRWLHATEATAPENIIYPWLLIPCINPDGFKKGRRVNANGVDLNRNFPVKSWTSEARAPRYFPGPNPGSEIETRAVVELIETYNPFLIVHCHSWNPCVVVTGSEGLKFGRFLSESSGYPLQEDIGYPTPGSLGEYGWLERKTPVICIEMPEKWDPTRIWAPMKEGIRRLFCEVPNA